MSTTTSIERFIVAGGRTFTDRVLAETALATMPADAVLVHGDCPGADQLCATIWSSWGRTVEAHPARWSECGPHCTAGHQRPRWDGSTYCPSAGPRRNQEMVAAGAQALLKLPGGRGTAGCVKLAQRAGIPVLPYPPGGAA